MSRLLLRRLPGAALVAALAAVGCGKPYDGVSEADRMDMARQSASDAAKGQGVKMVEKNYPPHGKAWVVDMSKMTVTDDHLRQVRAAGNVSELNLSGSTITDDQLGLIDEIGLGGFVLKFDLSRTGVTDAGLEKLKHLNVLQEMNLTGTKVTKGAVEKFLRDRQASGIPTMFKKPRIKS